MARLEMGKQISAFFWQKQVRGKKYLIEYQKRTGNLHYFFVYLSDYANSYEAWSAHGCELERRDESRAINMVFAYDEHLGYARQKFITWWLKHAPGCEFSRDAEDSV